MCIDLGTQYSNLITVFGNPSSGKNFIVNLLTNNNIYPN